MELTPLNDRVIIKKTKKKETSEGGILLPESEQEQSNTGTVISISSDNELGLEVGNTVLFGNYAGSEMKMHGETVLIVKSEELIAKIC